MQKNLNSNRCYYTLDEVRLVLSSLGGLVMARQLCHVLSSPVQSRREKLGQSTRVTSSCVALGIVMAVKASRVLSALGLSRLVVAVKSSQVRSGRFKVCPVVAVFGKLWLGRHGSRVVSVMS